MLEYGCNTTTQIQYPIKWNTKSIYHRKDYCDLKWCNMILKYVWIIMQCYSIDAILQCRYNIKSNTDQK